MGSKRKSLDRSADHGSSTNKSSSKVKVAIDSSKAKIQPVLATFTAAVPPVASTFSAYKCVDKEHSNRCIVVSETEKIEYVGQNFEDNKPLVKGCKYLVGVYDKAAGTVTFRKAPYVRVNPVVKSLKGSLGVPDRDISSRILEARNELGEEFGSKKRKSQLRAEERNKINMDTVQASKNIIEASIELRSSSMPTAQVLKAQEDTSRPVPKYNPTATVVSEIYDMEDLLPKAVSGHIDVTAFVKASDPKEYRKLLPSRSMFVEKKIQLLLEQEKPDVVQLRRLIYLSYLLRFTVISRTVMQRREGCLEALQCSPEVAQAIFERFAECVAGSVNPDGTPVYTKTPAAESRLICHICVLMLSVNNWIMYPAELAADLSIPNKKAESYLASVGCKLEAATAGEISAHTVSKRVRTNAGKKALLKAPIKFPKASKYRK
ncbi:RNA polymerase I associated factor, A49-like protein [Coemansia reversa NRRL 1564]|uniref:RNA polymerase I associated factor, A49-like protein n=1 Tax=Coemansia reversa (strain ATCC 12441 / NRRL 1564) TaxID=763665 RepID=A0A2G5B420_COERN|nr:RNA polymerase I associated factor, A49-like protein [Coemansia reversa NRRL 1564]|eukprot:PIA13746.1 RNA polymerase I associated factor, A49-like protein [Coemansia reversa NRRL 1564]